MEGLDAIAAGLSAHRHLDREKALAAIDEALKQGVGRRSCARNARRAVLCCLVRSRVCVCSCFFLHKALRVRREQTMQTHNEPPHPPSQTQPAAAAAAAAPPPSTSPRCATASQSCCCATSGSPSWAACWRPRCVSVVVVWRRGVCGLYLALLSRSQTAS